MLFVAAVTFVMYQKVHLLLNDIVVVATEGVEWFWEVHECTELHSVFQNYTTVISSTEIHTNNCVVLIN